MLIEVHAEILSFDDQIIDVIIFNGRNDSLNVHLVYILQIQFRSIVRADRQLIFGYRITGRQQCFRFFQLKGHIQQEFFAFANTLCAIIQFYGLGLLRSYFQVFDYACLNHFAVSQQFPFCIVTVQVTEEVFVVYVYDTVSQVGWSHPDGLVDMPDFVHMRIRFAVRAYQAVVHKVVVGSVIFVPVAAISIERNAVFCFPTQRLINEIPDKATLVFRIFADQIPIFFESPLRVAHRVRMFALDKRFVDVSLAIFFTTFIVAVHRAIDIGEFACPCLFVLHGT